jgi:ribosomal protein S18 acetylase RimI-like enzyme
MVTIQIATPDQIPEIKNVLSTTWIDTYGEYLPDTAIQKVTTTWHAPKILEEQIVSENMYFGVAKEDSGTIVGLVTISRLDPDNLILNRLYVLPDQQRQGIGQQLLQEGIRNFPGAKKMYLEIQDQNPKGLSFYQKQGFKELKRKEDQIDGATINVIVMEKELTSP